MLWILIASVLPLVSNSPQSPFKALWESFKGVILGMVLKRFWKETGRNWKPEEELRQLRSTTLLKSDKILGRVQDSRRDLLLLRLQWKSLFKTGVMNSQGEKNNIVVIVFRCDKLWNIYIWIAQLAEGVEYTDCFSAEGSDDPSTTNECPWYDTKSDDEVPVMLKLWGIPGVVAPNRIQ